MSDKLNSDLLQALKFETELSYEEILSIAISRYALLRLPSEQVTDILAKHGIKSK